jgi:hypothetical protein
MLFTQDAASGLANGAITLTFRTWSRPHARAGGRYRTCGLLIEVEDIRKIDVQSISDADAHRAGYPSAQALREELSKQEGYADQIWRVEFRCLGPDDRIARRNDATLDPAKLAKLEARLARLDQSSKTGPWTSRTLQLIASHPGVVSTTLARRLQMDRPAFKINVRKLKELGLTESLEVGYQLSPLGTAFVNRKER